MNGRQEAIRRAKSDDGDAGHAYAAGGGSILALVLLILLLIYIF